MGGEFSITTPGDYWITTDKWEQLYWGAAKAVSIRAIRQVVQASYDRIFIDEYQDCGDSQHVLAQALSEITPTLVFGDPMQGIFEFARATLSWEGAIYRVFPLATELNVPYRWKDKNPDLGAWIAETRVKLLRGAPIDLRDGRIDYRPADDAFDMSAFFDGHDGKEGSFAAIHGHKQICYSLAKATSGRFQAIEEMEGKTLMAFATRWDGATSDLDRRAAIESLLGDCFHVKEAEEGADAEAQANAIAADLDAITPGLGSGTGAQAAIAFLSMSRRHPLWKLYRSELWRDAERAASDLASGRSSSMGEAATNVRQRATHTGRILPTRTVSTPLLLKGLEFDHVVVPDARFFTTQRQAQAKLFYVAISRATRTLTITNHTPILQFPPPRL